MPLHWDNDPVIQPTNTAMDAIQKHAAMLWRDASVPYAEDFTEKFRKNSTRCVRASWGRNRSGLDSYYF